ncbi:MAG: 4Fe-4S binding protein [Methanosarcinaceae archaeon]|nr:4Fe-4S binding protein [Methanosarcinaceae archaeon]MDD4498517.1 4Fe-4S binding protein [Methanosarcinaceae archaeon]
MTKAVYVNLSHCIACKACELACEREYGEARVRVEVVLNGAGGGVGVPVSCRQCETPFCALACPENALGREVDGLKFDSGLCSDCGLCVLACPFGAIELKKAGGGSGTSFLNLSGTVVRCELCPGKETPVCVATCPAGALVYTDCESFGKNIRRGKGKKCLKPSPAPL